MSLIIPELFADFYGEELGVRLKMGAIATDMTDRAADIRYCGDTIHMPMVNHIGDAEDVPTDGSEMTPVRLSMTDKEVGVKHKGKTMLVTDKEVKQLKGDVNGEVARQLSDCMAKAIDTSLINDVLACDTYVESVSALTESTIEDAFDCFGDSQDASEFKAIVLSSKLKRSLIALDGFTSKEKTFTTDGNGIVVNGMIGYYRGVPCIMTDNGTYNSSTHKALFALIKRDGLGIIMQKEPTIAEAYNVRSFGTDVNASVMFATAADEGKISVLLVDVNP